MGIYDMLRVDHATQICTDTDTAMTVSDKVMQYVAKAYVG